MREGGGTVPGVATVVKVREADIQDAIRDYLRYTGWFVIRHQQGLGCHRGLADLSATKGGRTLWIEVKTARGRLSEWQERFRADIEAHGGVYIVARSPEDIQEALMREGLA